MLLHAQQIPDLLPRRHQRNSVRRPNGGQGLLHQIHQRLIAVRRLLAALQQQPVRGGDRQRGHLGQRVRPRLEYHQQHPDRDGDLLQLQPVGQPGPAQHPPDVRVAGLGDLLEAVREVLKLGGCQREPGEQRLRQAGLGGLGEVLRVGVEDVRLTGDEEVGEGVHALGALLRLEGLEGSTADSCCNG